MLRIIIRLRLFLLLACAGITPAYAEGLSPNIMNPDAIIAGRDYEVLENTKAIRENGKLQIIEAFSFGCPHCNDFEPLLHAWAQHLPQDATLARLPVVFGREPWRLLAKAYYVGESLGMSETIAPALFKALHVEHRTLGTDAAIADVFAGAGAKRDRVLELLGSAKIADQVKAAETAAASYKVTGVPALIVAGKYQTSASMAGDYERLLKVVDQLLDQERSAQP